MINDDLPTCQRDCDSATVGVCLYLWADESVSARVAFNQATADSIKHILVYGCAI